MRLINVLTGKLEEFFDQNIPQYHILSHTWGDDEISFQEFTWIRTYEEELDDGVLDELMPKQRERLDNKYESLRATSGYRKIAQFMDLVRERCLPWLGDKNVHYIWVDTCCINKESSAELSEAINSMYR